MGILQLVLLLLYAIGLASTLPITSTPLEDNPDHLANWDAHLTFADNRNYGGYEYEYEVRKIPKSIFITPHLNESTCPPGYRLASDGKCRPVNNINLNPDDILKTQLLGFLGQTNNNKPQVEYSDDYEYDESPQDTQNGPYHVPLSISFGDSAALTASSSSNSPFRDGTAGASANVVTTKQHYNDHHIYKDATRPDVVVVVSSTTANSGKRATESFTRSTESLLSQTPYVSSSSSSTVEDEMEIATAASTFRPTIITFNPTEQTLNDQLPTSTTIDREFATSLNTLENTPNIISTTQMDEEQTSTKATATTDTVNEPSTIVFLHRNTEATPAGQDDTEFDRQLQFELQSESLFQEELDASVLNSTIASGSGDGAGTTTELLDEVEAAASTPIAITMPAAPSEQIKADDLVSVTVPITPSTTPTVETVIVLAQAPTTDKVQIVTAVDQQRRPPPNEAVALPTDTLIGEINTNAAESYQIKRMRDAVLQHELKEDAIETTDQHNRFVYNHLGSPPATHHHNQAQHRIHTSTTTVAPPVTTQAPPVATTRSFLDQLRLYSKFTEENRRLQHQQQQRARFPQSSSSSNIFSNYRGSTIKFPGPATGGAAQRRLFTANANENQPKKPFVSSTPAPLFSWLPSWSFDRSGASSVRPVRFWDKIPLMSDPTYNNGDGTDRARENSKSPTDSLFKDLPTASEIYKVLTAKNSKHNEN